MSNYHVLKGDYEGKTYKVVMHIPIPSANNRVGVNYRDAIKAGENTTSVIPNHAANFATEATQMADGEIFEHAETLKTHPNNTLIEDRNLFDALYNKCKTEIQGKLQAKYSYYGYDRDVS